MPQIVSSNLNSNALTLASQCAAFEQPEVLIPDSIETEIQVKVRNSHLLKVS